MSHDAERALISALLLEPTAARAAVEHVAPDDFHDTRLGRVYGLVLGMVGSGNPVDGVLILEELRRRRAAAKDNTWLSPTEAAELTSVPASSALVPEHARVIRDAAVRREATKHLTRAYQDLTQGADPGPVIASALDGLRAVRDGHRTGDLMARALGEVLAESDSYEWVIPGLLEKGDRFVITGGEGAGKALALDTPLATPDGWTTMGEVRVGDYVFGADGSPTLVTAATDVMLDHECYRVEFSDGTHIVADRDHQWLTETYASRMRTAAQRRRGETKPRGTDQRHKRTHFPAVVTTAEIAATLRARDGHTLNHTINAAGALDLPETDLPIDPYTLGAWLGDGNTASAGFTCADVDDEIVGHIRAAGYTVDRRNEPHRWYISRREARQNAIQAAARLIAAGSSRRSAERAVGLPVGAANSIPAPRSGWTKQLREEPAAPAVRSFVEELRTLGVLGNKHIPTKYLRASVKQRLALLQGLMDTDGTVSNTGSGKGRGFGAARCEFSVTNQRLATDVFELVTSLGILARMSEGDAKLNGRVVSRRWRITFQTDLPVFRLTRKAQRLTPLRTERSRHRFITAVVPVESVPVRCISVDAPDHLFLAGRQMVPTHNSTLVRQIAVCSAAGVHPFTLAPIRPLSVLVVDAENSERQWRRNARAVVAQARKRGQEDPETRVHLACTRRLDITSERDLGAVHRLMDEHDPDMVVIGPLYKLVPRAITNDDDAAPLITALDSLRDRGVALVMEAHAGHGQSVPGQRDLRPRGSSALLGWPEFGFGLQLDKDQPHVAHLIRWRGDRDERDWPDTLERGGEFQWSLPRWSPSRGVA